MTLCQNPGQSVSAHTIFTSYPDTVTFAWSNIKSQCRKVQKNSHFYMAKYKFRKKTQTIKSKIQN